MPGLLSPSNLEDTPTGTLNTNGIYRANLEKINSTLDPAHTGAQRGLIEAALAGQAILTTIAYGASVNCSLLASQLQILALTGDVTIAVTNKNPGRKTTLILTADGTNRTVTWPVGAVWASPPATLVLAGTSIAVNIYSSSTADAGLILTTAALPTYASLGIVPKAYGGTGADNSAVTFPASGTLATITDLQAQIEGMNWKATARAKTTANVNLASGLANGTTHDGVTVSTGDRVLVASQTLPEENGIYIVPASGAASRAADASTGPELVNATLIVSEGTLAADSQYTCTTDAPITLGTTGLVFTGTGGGGSYLSGTGLTLTGNVFSIDTAITADLTTAQTLENKSLDEPRMESIHAPLTGLIGFAVDHVASAVNYVSVITAITGSAATVRAAGSDTNIDLKLEGKGSGVAKAATASPGTNTEQIANTAFVTAAVAAGGGGGGGGGVELGKILAIVSGNFIN